ncbi:MarR family winged helix-turn-helix transcriptional regulator [Amycolatopsis japonica]
MENPIGRTQRRGTVGTDADLYETGPKLPDGLTRWTTYVMSRATQRGWTLLNRRLESSEVSPRLHALLVVVRDRGPVSQQEISEVLRVDRTTIVAIADAAENAGYISRDRDRVDRRRYALKLTDAGRRELERADRLVAEAHDDLMADLTEAERETLHGLLIRLVPAAGEVYPEADR